MQIYPLTRHKASLATQSDPSLQSQSLAGLEFMGAGLGLLQIDSVVKDVDGEGTAGEDDSVSMYSCMPSA